VNETQCDVREKRKWISHPTISKSWVSVEIDHSVCSTHANHGASTNNEATDLRKEKKFYSQQILNLMNKTAGQLFIHSLTTPIKIPTKVPARSPPNLSMITCSQKQKGEKNEAEEEVQLWNSEESTNHVQAIITRDKLVG